MSIIDEIRSKVQNDDFEFSRHVADRMLLRYISVQNIREAIATGEVIEDYPNCQI
ncbi:DUF4258 domain-containing protein [Chloroflexi bacterium TSY]|nr:DUF4258 domain-containing protein [Chloroflexi bacterium TSY]